MATIVVVEDQPDSLKLITTLLTLKGATGSRCSPTSATRRAITLGRWSP